MCDIFPPKLIEIGLDAEDKDEVFEEMVNKFCQVMKDNNRDEILEGLWERESKMSTGIQKGIAIPHGKTGSVENICGILGI
jgi:PTS system fructose-specific IIC component/PTS system nitrogen regulatory IIA component